MRDYMTLGPVPVDESCAQVGKDDFVEKERKELRAYRHQLERQFPDPPEGVTFGVKHFAHDFGSYGEVVAKYDDDDEKQLEFVYQIEANLPDKWDDEARKELDL